MRSLEPEQQQSSHSLPNPITYRDGRPTPALRQGMQPNPPQLLAPPVCMQHQKANRHCTIAAKSLHSACLPSTCTSLPAHYHSEINSCCDCSCCSCATNQTTRHSQPVTAAVGIAARTSWRSRCCSCARMDTAVAAAAAVACSALREVILIRPHSCCCCPCSCRCRHTHTPTAAAAAAQTHHTGSKHHPPSSSPSC